MPKQISTPNATEESASHQASQKLEMPLAELYALHHGKVSDKWSSYLKVYDESFADVRSESIRLLEIGIQNGGSLEIWGKYFLRATCLVGCDIEPECGNLRYDDPRMHVIVGDANSDETENKILAVSDAFDIVIDDGSHRSGDIIHSFARYFNHVIDGGIYIIEDLHCSYWSNFDGGVTNSSSSMSFLKRLADLINYEHWGVDAQRVALLSSFENQYGVRFEESSLAKIQSIAFHNSLCVIKKSTDVKNSIGSRIVVGEVASVYSAPAGAVAAVPSQVKNRFSNLNQLPETELGLLRSARISNLALLTELGVGGSTLEEKIRQISSELKAERIRAKASEAQIQIVKRDLCSERAKLQIRSAQMGRLTAELVSHQSRLKAADLLAQQAQMHQHRVQDLLQSRSWRATAPVRWASTQYRKVKRGAKLIYRAYVTTDDAIGLTTKGLGLLRSNGWLGLRSKLLQVERSHAQHVKTPIASSADSAEDAARALFSAQQAEITKHGATRMVQDFAAQPLISVLMPVYKTPTQWLLRAVESLQSQFYENWELCAVDDCSPTPEQATLLKGLAEKDARIRVSINNENAGISATSNVALSMANGEYIALLDHDDELTPDAFFWIVKAINEHPETDFIYTDECKIDDSEHRHLSCFFFKPEWSPEFMFNGMLTGHLTVYNKELVNKVGGFRSAYDYSQDYDLALRISEVAKRIHHVERILYLWRSIPGSAASGGKDFARASNIAALDDALTRRGIPAVAVPLPHANYVKLDPLIECPLVSIIVPSDSLDNLRSVIRMVCDKTTYPNYELVLVCNGPLAERLADEFFSVEQLKFVHYNKKYNFSDKCNEGARAAGGGILVFYNDDVHPLQADWLERLIEYLAVPGVGAVSPKLVHEDDSIQYAGMISGTPGLAGTAYNNLHRDAGDDFLSMHKLVRNVSLLSGACCAIPSNIFWSVGAFDGINTPDGHSDMDLSFRLTEHGYRCVYTPYSVLCHIGNHSWGAKRTKYKADIYELKRRGKFLERDPFFPDSMKKILYKDFTFEYKIFAAHVDNMARYTGPDVLFASHELTLTGAPRMLLNAALAVKDMGGFPVVVAPSDGPLRQELIDNGIVVILDGSIQHNHFLFERFAANFDFVVVNTIALGGLVEQISKIANLNVVWWLHEGKSLKVELDRFTSLPWERVTVVSVSEYARQFIPSNIPAKIIYNGIVNCPGGAPLKLVKLDGHQISFLLAGTIEPRKGQDIFVEAIELLPLQVRSKCRFLIAGKLWEGNVEYWHRIEAVAAKMSEVSYVGALSHDELVSAISSVDVLVCPSRDDPFPLVVLEAALLGRPAILSSCVGSAEVFRDGHEAFVFASENAAELAEKILRLVEDPDSISVAGQAAQKLASSTFTVEAFKSRFALLASEIDALQKR